MKTTIRRDEIGAAPLFYCIHNNKMFHSSNIESLLADSNVKPRLDAEGIAELALLSPARNYAAGSAVLVGIKELPPGHQAEFDLETGKLTVTQYHKLQAFEHAESFEETSVTVRKMLTDSIVKLCVSNPCLFLSGGLDSSIIGAVMKEAGADIVSFSVDYEGNDNNFKPGKFQPTQDAPFVAEMQRYLNSRHENIEFSTDELFGSLSEATLARGFPGMADVDGSMYLFCKKVSEACDCALSGEAADELFGGYRWYTEIGEDLQTAKANETFFPWMQCVNARANLLNDGICKEINPIEYVQKARADLIKNVPFLKSDDVVTRKRREMFYLNYYGFLQTLGERNHTMSRTHGLRVLAPFADAKIAEYAFNIPWEMKHFANREKGLLRHAFGAILPHSVAWRKKSPFPKTHNPKYLSMVVRELDKIITASDCRITEIYNKKKLTELIESNGKSFGGENWFGQLMSTPQIFAHLIQVETWLKKFDVFVKC